MIVLDTNIVLDVLLARPHGPLALKTLEEADTGVGIVSVTLGEIGHVLRKIERSHGDIVVTEALRILEALRIPIFPAKELEISDLREIVDGPLDANDFIISATSRALDARLLTRDEGLLRHAPHTISITPAEPRLGDRAS